MRQLPSAKVCFLGGCPRSGRNRDPVGALPRSRRPPRRRALDCLHLRCLRVKAAEKGVQMTTPLMWDFWCAKLRARGTPDLNFPLRCLEGQGARCVKIVTRVGQRCEYRRKKGNVECERPARIATAHTIQGESRSPSRKERLPAAESKRDASASPFSGPCGELACDCLLRSSPAGGEVCRDNERPCQSSPKRCHRTISA